MKYLIMCEGSNELAVINVLLDNNCLKFTRDDLLNLTPFHARQIASSGAVKTALNIYPGNDVKILRIGDKQSDRLRIPKEYENQIVQVEKYCTKPELEVLLIIAEGIYSEYNKEKSAISPKEFAKQNIVFNHKRYDNSTVFYREYFGKDVSVLVNALNEYKRIHRSHKRDELYLADLLK